MKTTLLVCLTSLLSLSGLGACAADRATQAAWLDTMIARFASEPVANPPRQIRRYRYRDQTVYYVAPSCCDQPSVLYDVKGSAICAPDGGMTGRGDGRCTDFNARRSEETMIWSDPRSR